MHSDKHTAKMIIKLATAMPGAVAAWLVFSKLKDDSRALETICMDGFWDEWSSTGLRVEWIQTMLLLILA